MTAHEHPSGPAELLAEAGWLRGLARSLTSDPELALELEQETWRAALARPPRPGPGLRAWLRTVAANLLRRRRRDELARRWHEAAAAGPEAREEEATLERLELQARIVAAVRALPEPCRTAVALRHLDGLDYGEVARRTHVDEAAARQRVSRGLKLLRARLDRAYGGRTAWGVAAFALGRDLPVPSSAALAAAGGAGTAALLGGLGMSAGIKLGAAVTAGALIAGAWWWVERGEGASALPERAAAAPAAQRALAPAEEAGALDAPLGETGGARLALPAGAEAAAAAPAAEERITGTVVDQRGAPVAGAEVELLRFSGRDYGTLDRDYAREERRVARVRAGEDGRFALSAEAQRQYALRARADGLAPAELGRAFAGDDVELRLLPAGALWGLVLRPDELPASGAEVSTGGRRTATDRNGRYRFDGLQPGKYTLEVSSNDGATPRDSTVTVEAGSERRVDFRLERGIELRGRVVDATTGAPIAGAEICESWIFAKVVTTGADGEFVYPDFPQEGYVDITVRAAGYGQRGVDVMGPFEAIPVESYLELELHPAATVTGRVLAPDGSALEDVYVACAASVLGDEGQQIDWRSARTGGDGRYRIADVRTDVPHALFLQRDGLGTAVFEIGMPQREHAVPDIVLRAGVPISGRVVDESGAPRAGAEVLLHGSNSDRASRFGHAAESFLDSYVAERETRTDAKGRFSFTDVSDGEYSVLVQLRGTHGEERHPCTVAGAPVDLGRIELAGGLAIAGRIVDPQGRGAGGVYVNLWSETDREAWASVLSQGDGSFELVGLEPGPYQLQFVPYQAHEGQFLARTLRGGVPAGTSGHVIQLAEAVELRGRVVDAAGAPVPNASVELSVPNEPGAWEQTNAEGRFAFHPPRGAKVELVAHPEKESADRDLPYQYDPDPAREARLSGVDPERGEVQLVLPDAR